MTEDLENALRRTLADAAARAPKAPPYAGIAPAPTLRVRHGHTKVALAAAAVAVAIGGATAGGRLLLTGSGTPDGRHATTARSPALHRPPRTAVPPIEKVWPRAVHRLPGALPGGRKFGPAAAVDDHTLLVTTESSFEKADAVYAYDLRNHATRRVTTVITPPGTKTFASDFATGGGYVTWWLAGDTGLQIWAAPLSGGKARLVASMRARGVYRLQISGTDAVWSVEGTGGVYRAALTGGGPVRMVPGSTSKHLLAWPWIGAPPSSIGDDTSKPGVRFSHIENAVTGQKRSARLTDRVAWLCDVTWCVGKKLGSVTEAQRRDGGGRHAIPDTDDMELPLPLLDRFVITWPNRDTMAVYDLRTGKIGDLGIKWGKQKSFVTPSYPTNALYWTMSGNGWVVVDLAAI